MNVFALGMTDGTQVEAFCCSICIHTLQDNSEDLWFNPPVKRIWGSLLVLQYFNITDYFITLSIRVRVGSSCGCRGTFSLWIATTRWVLILRRCSQSSNHVRRNASWLPNGAINFICNPFDCSFVPYYNKISYLSSERYRQAFRWSPLRCRTLKKLTVFLRKKIGPVSKSPRTYDGGGAVLRFEDAQ